MENKVGWVVLVCVLVLLAVWLVNPKVVGRVIAVISTTTTTTSTSTSTTTTQRVEFKCPKPYIQIGTDCCLDKNENSICDKDEKCPTSCDDRNDCTEDYCSYETNYECEHKVICYCGDGVCNLDENFKTCKEDCIPTKEECAVGYSNDYFNFSMSYTCHPINYYTVLYSEDDFRKFYEFCSSKRAAVYTMNGFSWSKSQNGDIKIEYWDKVDFSNGITLGCGGTPEVYTCFDIPDWYCYLTWNLMEKNYYEYPISPNHEIEKECNTIKSGEIIQKGSIEFYNGLKIYKPSLCRIQIKED